MNVIRFLINKKHAENITFKNVLKKILNQRKNKLKIIPGKKSFVTNFVT